MKESSYVQEPLTPDTVSKSLMARERNLGNLSINGASTHLSCENRIVLQFPVLQAAEASKQGKRFRMSFHKKDPSNLSGGGVEL